MPPVQYLIFIYVVASKCPRNHLLLRNTKQYNHLCYIQGKSKNQLQPGQQSMWEAPVFPHCSSLRNLWPKPTSCQSIAMKEKPTFDSSLFGVSISDHIPKAKEDVNVHIFIHSCTLRDKLIMDNALTVQMCLQYNFSFTPFYSKSFATRWWWWLFPFIRLLFCLWIVQKAPCCIPCDYDVKEFVVFISHINEVTGNAHTHFSVLVRQHSKYQMLTNTVHVHHIMKSSVTTSYRNSNLWCNLVHCFPSVTSNNLWHMLDICFICWHWWVTTTWITVNTLVSNTEAFMLNTHLIFFQCSVTIHLLQHISCLCWWFLQPNTKLLHYSHFQLWYDLWHTKETNKCYYAFRGYEMAKLLLWWCHAGCKLETEISLM